MNEVVNDYTLSRGRRDRSQTSAGDPGPRRFVHDGHLRVSGQEGPTQSIAGKCLVSSLDPSI
jgi:hypothetical protein